jgi:hypothetical protein
MHGDKKCQWIMKLLVMDAVRDESVRRREEERKPGSVG